MTDVNEAERGLADLDRHRDEWIKALRRNDDYGQNVALLEMLMTIERVTATGALCAAIDEVQSWIDEDDEQGRLRDAALEEDHRAYVDRLYRGGRL